MMHEEEISSRPYCCLTIMDDSVLNCVLESDPSHNGVGLLPPSIGITISSLSKDPPLSSTHLQRRSNRI